MLAYIVAGLILAFILYNLFSGGPPKQERKTYHQLIENNRKGESPIIRNWRVKDKLYDSKDGLKTCYDAFQVSREKYANKNCLGARSVVKTHYEDVVVRGEKKKFQFLELGPYKWETYEEVGKRVDNFGFGLLEYDLKARDTIAVYSETRPEWTMSTYGAFSQDIVVATIYANLGHDPMVFALNEGEIRHIITNASLLPSLVSVVKKVPTLKYIIYTDEAKKSDIEALEKAKDGLKFIHFKDVEKAGQENPKKKNQGKPDEVAVIMYTSGSTGNPKGVMITHQNIIAAIVGTTKSVEITNNEILLSYLPLAHILAFVLEAGVIIYGGSIGYGNPRTLTDQSVRNCKGDITELRPTFFVGVPSVYDKIKSGITQKVKKSSKIQQFIFNRALDIKKSAMKSGLRTPIMDKLVFDKIKSALGGRVRFLVSGGAPLSPQCAEFMSVCFSVPLVQGYGLTETTGSACISELDTLDVRACTVGAPNGATEVKLIDVPDMKYFTSDKKPTGEIWIKGASVTKGYFKNPEKTKEDFTEDGWFKTGDIGQLNPNGTIQIVDRKKNLIKPPHGEYIAVERLESLYKNSSLVENIMVYASSEHNQLIALVHPKKGPLEDKVKGKDFHELCKSEEAKKAVLKSLDEIWKESNLKSIERISAVLLYDEEWTPENGWLTAAQKLKRNDIQKEHEKEINEVYEGLDE